MESFARLFRSSKLCSLDTGLQQVLTAPPANRRAGNWGLKHWMPQDVKSRAVTLCDARAIDRDGWCEWRSADHVLLRREAFAENILPHLVRRAGAAADTPIPAAVAARAARVSAPAPVSRTPSPLGRHPGARQIAQRLGRRAAADQSDAKFADLLDGIRDARAAGGAPPPLPLTPSDAAVHPPFYGIHDATPPARGAAAVRVSGRILRRCASLRQKGVQGYAVGVAGFVAFLPESKFVYTASMASSGRGSHRAGLQDSGRRALHEFWVESVTFDADGRPLIELTGLRPDARAGGLLAVGNVAKPAAPSTAILHALGTSSGDSVSTEGLAGEKQSGSLFESFFTRKK